MAKELVTEELNPKQELFCQLYCTDKEFFGNGVETYLEVYDIDKSKKGWYQSACAAASRLLSNVKVLNRINELLEEGGLNDAFVDKQLKFLITQNADYTNKLGALKEYNKLKQRITDKLETKHILPTPLLDYVFNNNGNEKDNQPQEAIENSAGGDISEQVNLDTLIPDTSSPE